MHRKATGARREMRLEFTRMASVKDM
jgi:hypothetical protein